MKVFQWISLPLIGLLALNSLIRIARGRWPRWIHLASATVWLAAGAAIAVPDTTTSIARVLGIGRGADLLIYVVAIAFIVVTFYFYHRYRQLTIELTRLTRHLALKSARPSEERSPAEDT